MRVPLPELTSPHQRDCRRLHLFRAFYKDEEDSESYRIKLSKGINSWNLKWLKKSLMDIVLEIVEDKKLME